MSKSNVDASSFIDYASSPLDSRKHCAFAGVSQAFVRTFQWELGRHSSSIRILLTQTKKRRQFVGWAWSIGPPGTQTGNGLTVVIGPGGVMSGKLGVVECGLTVVGTTPGQFTKRATLQYPIVRSNKYPTGQVRCVRVPNLHWKYFSQLLASGRLIDPISPHCVQSTVPTGLQFCWSTLKS